MAKAAGSERDVLEKDVGNCAKINKAGVSDVGKQVDHPEADRKEEEHHDLHTVASRDDLPFAPAVVMKID